MSEHADGAQSDAVQSAPQDQSGQSTDQMRPPPSDTAWLLTEEIRGAQPTPDGERFISRVQPSEDGDD